MIYAINGMYLTTHATGIANVIINVVRELSKKNQIIIFANKCIENEVLERLPTENIQYIIGNRKSSTLWFFLDFPKLLKKYKFEYLWLPAVWIPLKIPSNVKTIVSVNDFVSKDFKSTMRFFNRLISNFIEKKSIKKADYIWCISNYTKNRLEELYPKRKCKNIFVGLAPDPYIKKIEISKNTKDELYAELGIKKDFIFFVGSVEPRKNLKFLLEIYRNFHKYNDLQLVVVGASGWGNTGLAEIVNSPNFPREDVIFTGFVTELQLIQLYNCAKCFVSTSINEGFGLPQVEAMRCECPVVTAHNSAMIEVVSGAGITVEGWNIEDWLIAIDSAIKNRNEIIKKQNDRKTQYQWDNIISRFYEYLGI